MKKTKNKSCKQCGKEFTPFTSLQKCCSPKCELKLSKEKAKTEKKKKREAKKVSVSSLSKKLDILFSKYVRLRDSLLTTGTPDSCVCVTSGETVSGMNLHNGHFFSRRHKALRWCECNAHGQSAKSNLYGAGEQYLHGLAVDRIHGPGTAMWISMEAAKAFKLTRYSKIWVDKGVPMTMEEAIEHYQSKIQSLYNQS